MIDIILKNKEQLMIQKVFGLYVVNGKKHRNVKSATKAQSWNNYKKRKKRKSGMIKIKN